MPSFNNLDFRNLYRKRRKLGWYMEDDMSDDEDG